MAAVLLVILAGRPVQTQAQDPDDDLRIVRIGISSALSGASEEFGKSVANAAELAVTDVNRQGLIIKGKRVHLRLQRMDDRGQTNAAIDVARELIRQGVSGVIGPMGSPGTEAVLPLYTNAGIPLITPAASSPSLARMGSASFFRMVPSDDEITQAVAFYLVRTLSMRRVAVVDNGGLFGIAAVTAFVSHVRALGAEVVFRGASAQFSSDMRPLAHEAKARGAQAIFYGGYVGDALTLANAIEHEGGGMRLVLASSAAVGPIYLAGARGAAEGTIAAEPGVPLASMHDWPRFKEHYQRRFGTEIFSSTPFAYDAVLAMVAAMRLANSDEPRQVAAALRRVSVRGLTGMVEFDRFGNRRQPAFTLFEVRQLRWVPVKVVDDARSRAPAAGPQLPSHPGQHMGAGDKLVSNTAKTGRTVPED